MDRPRQRQKHGKNVDSHVDEGRVNDEQHPQIEMMSQCAFCSAIVFNRCRVSCSVSRFLQQICICIWSRPFTTHELSFPHGPNIRSQSITTSSLIPYRSVLLFDSFSASTPVRQLFDLPPHLWSCPGLGLLHNIGTRVEMPLGQDLRTSPLFRNYAALMNEKHIN